MKKIGIIGSRRRNSMEDLLKTKKAFWKVCDTYHQIVSGGCPEGGDRFAEEIAKQGGLSITIHYPNWNKYKKAAGFMRNDKIANDCVILIACVAEDRKGGTEDTIKKFLKNIGKSESDAIMYDYLILV